MIKTGVGQISSRLQKDQVMKLIHISDVHIHGETILSRDPVANFQACIDHINKYNSDADMIVITGDLAHRGDRQSYLTFQHLLQNLPKKPHLIIGNHDNRETFLEIFPETAVDKNGYVQFSIEQDDGYFIFIDTLDQGKHSGLLGQKRLQWIENELAGFTAPEKPIYLFMHHNPCDVGVANADVIGLRDAAEFQQILEKYKDKIRHIFFGHCHYILSGSLHGIPLSAPHCLNHNCVPEFSGNAELMGETTFRATYNVCLIEPASLIVHSIDFLGDAEIKWHGTIEDGWINEKGPASQ